MLAYLDSTSPDYFTSFVQVALDAAYRKAFDQWNVCYANFTPWTTSTGIPTGSSEPEAVAQAITPLGSGEVSPEPVGSGEGSIFDQGIYINKANQGTITATLIKGTGTLVVAGIGITTTLLADQKAKIDTATIAAGL